MDAGDAVGQLLDPIADVGAAHLHPVGVQGEAQLVGGEALQQRVYHQLAVELLELDVVVVVHQQLAGRGDFLGGLFVVIGKVPQPLGAGVLLGHHADADVIAAHDVVLSDDGLGIVEDTVGVGVGEDNLQAVLVANLPHLLGGDGADGGNLHGFVAHLGHLAHGIGEILGGLGVITQCKELGAQLHHSTYLPCAAGAANLIHHSV